MSGGLFAVATMLCRESVKKEDTHLLQIGCCRFIVASKDKELFRVVDCGYEVVALAKLFGIFPLAVHGWVDGSREVVFCLPERRSKLRKSNITDDHEVHVARGKLFSSGDRTVNEGALHSFRVRFEHVAKHVPKAHGLEEDALEFVQDGTLGVGFEVDPVSVAALLQDPRGNELLEVASQCLRYGAQGPCQVA